jgi:hypothetical protein
MVTKAVAGDIYRDNLTEYSFELGICDQICRAQLQSRTPLLLQMQLVEEVLRLDWHVLSFCFVDEETQAAAVSLSVCGRVSRAHQQEKGLAKGVSTSCGLGRRHHYDKASVSVYIRKFRFYCRCHDASYRRASNQRTVQTYCLQLQLHLINPRCVKVEQRAQEPGFDVKEQT